MKKNILVIMVILVALLLSGCGDDKSNNSSSETATKDKFIGIWLKWNDNQTFMADNYVKNKYLNNENVSFAYVPENNGLYVFNYIIYKDGKIENRETVASKEFYVEDTVYDEDSISNIVHMYRTIDFPENIYFYRIYEKFDGTIYMKEESKEQYYSETGAKDQKKEFLFDKYDVCVVFEDVEKLESVVMSAYTTDGTFVDKYDISLELYQAQYRVADNVKYVEFEEHYVDANNNKYSKKVFEPFNTDDWTINYNCMFNEKGVGKKVDINVIH